MYIIKSYYFFNLIGLEPHGNKVGNPARFTIDTFSAGRGAVDVIVLNPKGHREPVIFV